jgi:ubiquinone/menaquinone biosynthesis C-methylase UbiE
MQIEIIDIEKVLSYNTEDMGEYDWSKKRFKRLLVGTRKYAWLDDTVIKIADWLGFKHRMSVVDVGCGLGYLGYTYWRFYGKGGRYIGIDINVKLLKDTKKLAKDWAKRGRTYFLAGDAYKLPLCDNCVDFVMCQTLFIELKEPMRALAEMIRIVKPGGIVMCVEPDNLSYRSFTSLPELNIKDKVLMEKYTLIWNKGRIKLGQGDYTIGNKVLHMMKESGLIHVDARINDKVNILEPPYEGPMQQHQLKMVKRNLRNTKKERKFWLNHEKQQFLAGGGNLKDFNRVMRLSDKHKSIMKKQLKNHKYFHCFSGLSYVIKGTKPNKKSIKKKKEINKIRRY